MPSETQFTPLGPAAVGFQTDGANIDVGGDIGGNKVGGKFNCISGSAIEAISDPDNISSSNLAAVVVCCRVLVCAVMDYNLAYLVNAIHQRGLESPEVTSSAMEF